MIDCIIWYCIVLDIKILILQLCWFCRLQMCSWTVTQIQRLKLLVWRCPRYWNISKYLIPKMFHCITTRCYLHCDLKSVPWIGFCSIGILTLLQTAILMCKLQKVKCLACGIPIIFVILNYALLFVLPGACRQHGAISLCSRLNIYLILKPFFWLFFVQITPGNKIKHSVVVYRDFSHHSPCHL